MVLTYEIRACFKVRLNISHWFYDIVKKLFFSLNIHIFSESYLANNAIGVPHVILKIYKVCPYTIYSWRPRVYSIGVDIINF